MTRAPKGTRPVGRSRRTGRRRSGYRSSEEDFGEAINNAPEFSPGVLYLQGRSKYRPRIEDLDVKSKSSRRSGFGGRRSEVDGKRTSRREE